MHIKFSTDDVHRDSGSLYSRRKPRDVSTNVKVCNLQIHTDVYMWEHVMDLPHIQHNEDLAKSELLSLITQHVQSLRVIFSLTEFEDYSRNIRLPKVSFRVDDVRINTTKDCQIPNGSPFCEKNMDSANFINLLTRQNHKDFCLVYGFTYREFEGGLLGLAWVGTLCEGGKTTFVDGKEIWNSHNTGLVSFVLHGYPVPPALSHTVFAHEIGHSFGSKHDDTHKDEPYGCFPDSDDPKGYYIMFSSATSGDKQNNQKYSRCSINSMTKVIQRVLSSDNNCLLDSQSAFCGNRLVEKDEECDCGLRSESCTDVCCHAGDTKNKCKLKKTISFGSQQRNVMCSPTTGECCTADCQFRNQSHKCLEATECHDASYCDSKQSKCPAPINLPDGTPCQNHTKTCKNGECSASICGVLSNWQDCSLTSENQISPDMMCFVACRKIAHGSPCISTSELSRNKQLQLLYPELAGRVLYNGRALPLNPGTPCDNYRGYCDIFHQCQPVVAKGPLQLLQQQFFNRETLQKALNWITLHWWAVALIILGCIILLVVMMRIFAYNTPAVSIHHFRHSASPRGQLVCLSATRQSSHRSVPHRPYGVSCNVPVSSSPTPKMDRLQVSNTNVAPLIDRQ